MIELTKYEKQWIKHCKTAQETDPISSLKPLFKEIYGWDPDEHYDDFLDCMFRKLLDIYMKIQDDQSGNNVEIREIILSAIPGPIFKPRYEKPLERIVSELMSKICLTSVLKPREKRFELT